MRVVAYQSDMRAFAPQAQLAAIEHRWGAFFVRVAEGRVEVGGQPIDDADLKVVSTYEDALPIARDPDAPAAQPSVMEQRIAEGRLEIMGNPSDVPATLAELDLHRLLSSRTL